MQAQHRAKFDENLGGHHRNIYTQKKICAKYRTPINNTCLAMKYKIVYLSMCLNGVSLDTVRELTSRNLRRN